MTPDTPTHARRMGGGDETLFRDPLLSHNNPGAYDVTKEALSTKVSYRKLTRKCKQMLKINIYNSKLNKKAY